MFSKNQQAENAAMLDMDIQQEDIMAFFQEYWKSILGIAALLIVLTAGLQSYRAYDARAAAEQTAALIPLSQASATPENAKALEQFAHEKASGNRRILALMFAAGKYEILNQPEEAKRVLDGVAKSSTPNAVKDYARILMANNGDTAALDKIAKNSAWQPAVQELQALAQTDPQKRRDIYGEIASDNKAPPALRQRAAEFSGQTAIQ